MVASSGMSSDLPTNAGAISDFPTGDAGNDGQTRKQHLMRVTAANSDGFPTSDRQGFVEFGQESRTAPPLVERMAIGPFSWLLPEVAESVFCFVVVMRSLFWFVCLWIGPQDNP